MIGDPRLSVRFWAKVTEADSGCWLWTGCKNSRGYGCWGVFGKSQLTHRVAHEAFVGPIPEGLTIDHLCRVKACCNPAHLEAVTQTENTRRAYRDITHCVNGHEYTPGNTAIHARGTRSCIECRRDANRRYRARVFADVGKTRRPVVIRSEDVAA